MSSLDGTSIKAPEWHPPYEGPRNLRFPLHFDKSAKRIAFDEDEDPVCERDSALGKEVANLRRSQGIGAWIYPCTAVSASSAEATPVFFQVDVWPDDCEKVREVHYQIMEAIRGHHPPEEFEQFRTPFVGYFKVG